MKLTYEEGDLVKLRRVEELPDHDDWGLDQEGYDAILASQENGSVFEITCESCDDYYDIENVKTGETFEAINSYHFKPNSSLNNVITGLDLNY